MSADLLSEIAPILRALTDSAGVDVVEATKCLHQLVVLDPAKTLVLLAQIGAQGVGGFQSDARMIALISLNRLMFNSLEGLYLNKDDKVASTPWFAVPETMRIKIEDSLCHGLKDEMDMKVRKSIALCAARWTEESHARNSRPFRELPAIVVSLTASIQTWHRYTAFQILANCPLLFYMCDKENSVSSQDIANFILGGMTDTSIDTRLEAMNAMSKLMLHDGDVMRGDTSCREPLIASAFVCLTTIPWKARETGLEHLVELASEKPSFFLKPLDVIVGYLLAQMAPDPIDMYEFTTVKRDRDYDRFNWQDVGTQSSELLLALAEGYPNEFLKDHRQDTLKNIVGSYIGAHITAFDPHVDQQTWSHGDPDDEDYPEYPEEALTRLGEALPSASLLLVVTNHAQGLLKNKDWRARYCITMAIACIATGCRQFVDLKLLLAGMDQCRVDVDARVRYAWLELVLQLSLNPDGKMQKTSLNATVDACKPLLQDPSPRIRAQAARCLTGVLSPKFTEYSNTLKDREQLVDLLFTTFDNGPPSIQSEVLHTLSTLAELLGPQCKALYRPWMGKLLGILGSDGDSKTQGTAIVNATTLVAAVGTEESANDLAQLGPMMLRYHNSLDDTSDEWPILLFSWERLASTLEDAFAPMLPMIMPRIIKSASIPPDEDPDPWVCTEEGKDKAEALTALWFYANNVPTGFAQYLQPVWHLVLESLNLGFHAEVKQAAFKLVPLLLHQIKGNQQLEDTILESIWKELMEAFDPIMHVETEYAAITACFVALRDVIRVLNSPPPIDAALKIFKYAHTRAGEVQILRGIRAEDAEEFPLEDMDASDVVAEEEELLLDIERIGRTLKEYMRGVPEVYAAYRLIYELVGDLVDGQWSI